MHLTHHMSVLLNTHCSWFTVIIWWYPSTLWLLVKTLYQKNIKINSTVYVSWRKNAKPSRTSFALIHHTTLLTCASSCVTCPLGLWRTCDIHAFKRELSARLSSAARTRGHTQTHHCFESCHGSADSFLLTGAWPLGESAVALQACPHLNHSYTPGLLILSPLRWDERLLSWVIV